MILKTCRYIISAICIFTLFSCAGINGSANVLNKNNIRFNHTINNIGLIISTSNEVLVSDKYLVSKIENLFKYHLNKHGFTITQTDKYLSVENTIKPSFLPFYNHMNGRLFKEKFSQFKLEALNLYRNTYHLDIILKIEITMQNVRVSSSKAEWHNVYQEYSQPSETMLEYIPAYSLSTEYINNSHLPIYKNTYGLTLKDDDTSFNIEQANYYKAVINEIIKPFVDSDS